MKKFLISLALCGAVALPAFAQNTITNYQPVTDELLKEAPAADWLMYRQNQNAWGFSPLDQINVDNVKELQLVWSRAMESGSNEGTALVHDGVMFVANPRDVIQAIDAASGDLIWEYRRVLPPTSELSVLGEHTRSVALYEDKVFYVSWDNYIVALDAASGQLAWETDRGDADLITNSAGPIIANGVVVAGSTCQFAGRGCYVTGHDADSGEELWRNTFIPRPGEPGDETWAGSPFESRWMTGVWGAITFDAELDLVYYGTSAVGPASETVRGTPGGTLAGTNTRFAVNPKTGEIAWSHQTLPRDNWDQECTFEMLTVTSAMNPNADAAGMMAVNPNASFDEARKVHVGVPCKTAVAWAFDAETGEFFYAKETTEQNLIDNIDETGLVTVNEDVVVKVVGETYEICPTFLGGRDWPTSAYSPESNTLFVPLNNLCADAVAWTDEPEPADVYAMDLDYYVTPGKENVGRIDAINVETGDTVWSYEQPAGLYSPVMATAGGLLFTGGVDRYFRALDQETGEQVWQTRLPATVHGHASSFAVDGRQYIAIMSGGALAGGSVLSASPAGTDGPTGSNALFVFALPEGN
jgi:alcohol dehydrogenase (cytochrome c)